MDFLTQRSIKAAKREVSNILDSYHHYWDILSELAQNSRDAINRRNKKIQCKGVIKLKVDYQSRSVEIFDNGTGITNDQIKSILSPGGGDKSLLNDEIGEKGVGLTFCIFSGNYFEAVSRGEDGVLHGGKIESGNKWVYSDDLDNIPEYDLIPETSVPDKYKENKINLGDNEYDISTFTLIKISHINKSGDDIDLFEKTVDQLKFLLRTRSILGNTSSLWEKNAQSEFDFLHEFKLPDSGSNFVKGKISPLYPKLHELTKESVHLHDVQKIFMKKSTTKERRKYLEDKTIFSVYKKSWSGGKNVSVYGVMFAGNRIFDQISKNNLNLLNPKTQDEDEIEEIFRSGIFVATKSMPTGIEISPKKGGRYPAYYRRCIFIVEYDDLKFDVGRKSVSNYWKGVLQSAVAELFTQFEDIAIYQKDEKFKPGQGPVDEESPAEREARKKKEWTIYQGLVELDLPQIKYKKVPNGQEAAVAAIFHEILGADLLKNYEPLSTGYGARYDMHCNYYKDPSVKLEVVIEFKHSLESIIKDLEDSSKFWNDIHLLVAWNANAQKLKDSGFELVKSDEQMFEGVTHLLEIPVPGVDAMPVILLQTFIDKNQNPQLEF